MTKYVCIYRKAAMWSKPNIRITRQQRFTGLVIVGFNIFNIGTEAEIQLPLKRSSRFQRLFPNPSWLVWGRASRHQKLAPTFPGIDSCLMVTKGDFSKWKLKVDCLPNAVGKQPSIPLIYLGRKWTLNWWWWWWWWSASDETDPVAQLPKPSFWVTALVLLVLKHGSGPWLKMALRCIEI